MTEITRFDIDRGISDVYVKAISDLYKIFRLHTTIKILVVLDGSISLTEGNSVFGVGRVVRLLRESIFGCTRCGVKEFRSALTQSVKEMQPLLR